MPELSPHLVAIEHFGVASANNVLILTPCLKRLIYLSAPHWGGLLLVNLIPIILKCFLAIAFLMQYKYAQMSFYMVPKALIFSWNDSTLVSSGIQNQENLYCSISQQSEEICIYYMGLKCSQTMSCLWIHSTWAKIKRKWIMEITCVPTWVF